MMNRVKWKNVPESVDKLDLLQKVASTEISKDIGKDMEKDKRQYKEYREKQKTDAIHYKIQNFLCEVLPSSITLGELDILHKSLYDSIIGFVQVHLKGNKSG